MIILCPVMTEHGDMSATIFGTDPFVHGRMAEHPELVQQAKEDIQATLQRLLADIATPKGEN